MFDSQTVIRLVKRLYELRLRLATRQKQGSQRLHGLNN